MYNKILVPMDGSELAECVLPHVEAIAAGCQAKEVVFVRVVEDLKDIGEPMLFLTDDQLAHIETTEKTVAKEYLNKLVDGINLGNSKVSPEIIRGHAAETIADYAVHHGVDLIIIATHGRSGIGRWVYGSVAERILKSSCVPVLMVRAPGCMPGI